MTGPEQVIRAAGPGQTGLLYLDQTGSTNTWAREHLSLLGDLDAVYTTDQTKGRGRLGRTWENARGDGLYYTILVRRPLADPLALPLLASVAAARALKELFGLDCQIKWPNDLLVEGRKVCGILCELVPEGILCGIGINLRQSPEFFVRAGLPYGGSVYGLTGVMPGPDAAQTLALLLADHGFAPLMEEFAVRGFAAIREEYRAACVNLGRPVEFDGGRGIARDLDEQGRLLVRTETGETAVFTGEVSVRGIYGKL